MAVNPATAQRREPPLDLTQTLQRVGERLEQWYARAQTVVSTETVWIQPLRGDLTPVDFPRRLAFELRVGWDPNEVGPGGLPKAHVFREKLSVNGRSLRDNDEPGCMDPKPVSPEPLEFLLPARLPESVFSVAGTARVDGRQALMIDFHGASAAPAAIEWTDECVSVSLPGRSRGRVWVDAATNDVLRVDDRLEGTFEFKVPREQVRRGAAPSMVIEKAESSIRYQKVDFQDPPETLMLPVEIYTVTVIRGGGMQRFRITQRFSNHRRFITGSRVLP